MLNHHISNNYHRTIVRFSFPSPFSFMFFFWSSKNSPDPPENLGQAGSPPISAGSGQVYNPFFSQTPEDLPDGPKPKIKRQFHQLTVQHDLQRESKWLQRPTDQLTSRYSICHCHFRLRRWRRCSNYSYLICWVPINSRRWWNRRRRISKCCFEAINWEWTRTRGRTWARTWARTRIWCLAKNRTKRCLKSTEWTQTNRNRLDFWLRSWIRGPRWSIRWIRCWKCSFWIVFRKSIWWFRSWSLRWIRFHLRIGWRRRRNHRRARRNLWWRTIWIIGRLQRRIRKRQFHQWWWWWGINLQWKASKIEKGFRDWKEEEA